MQRSVSHSHEISSAMNVFIRTLLGSGALLITACAPNTSLVSNSGTHIDLTKDKVHSIKDLKEINIEMQNEDYSCGAASLATLMRHYFNDDVNERKVLDTVKEMFNEEEYELIAERGLSFMELSQVSKVLGFQSASVRLTSDALHKLRGPVLVYLETAEYKHFAVFRGFNDDFAYLADPSRGNVRLAMGAFLNEWKGQALVLGKKGFGVPLEHKLTIVDSLPHDETVIFRQLENRLAPTQKELLGGTYEI